MRQTREPIRIGDVVALVGEGPVWLARQQKLLWIDIAGSAILQTDLTTGETQRFPTRFKVGAIAPRKHGGYLAATFTGLYEVDSTFDRWSLVCHPEADRPGNRFNDGKCDAWGRFWIGSTHMTERGRSGALYVVHQNLKVERVLDGLVLCNGIDWSPDGRTLYVTDTGDRVIWAFEFDGARVRLGNRRAFAAVDTPGWWPDGLCVDQSGHVWSANWGGGSLSRYAPDGTVESTWYFPVSQITSCTFGGPSIKTLCVTSASIGLTDEQRLGQPAAGGLFQIDTDHAGKETNLFAG